MYHDGKTYIWVPSQLTLWQLTAETAAIVNAVHGMIGKPLVSAGDQNPYYLALNDLDMGGAPFTRDATPGMAVCGPIQNLSYLPIDYITLIVLFGGDVEGLPVWFEIDDINASVPLPWQSIDSERKTWADWGTFGESHKPRKIGTKWYRSSAVGASGQLLDASQFVGLGLTVLTRSQYLDILPSSPI